MPKVKTFLKTFLVNNPERNVDNIVTALNTSDKQSETPTVKFEIDKSNY